MAQNGDAGHDHNRLRMQENPILLGSNRQKEKDLGPNQETFLLVRIMRAVDIDRDFRAVINERFYGVLCWINPGEEYRTKPVVPNLFDFNLDPVWDEMLTVPLGETKVWDAVLHLEVIRGSRIAEDPGCSNGRKLVGRAEFKGLDQLVHGRIVKLKLDLMEPRDFGCKPEGYIFLEMQLLIFGNEQLIGAEQPNGIYESRFELLGNSN